MLAHWHSFTGTPDHLFTPFPAVTCQMSAGKNTQHFLKCPYSNISDWVLHFFPRSPFTGESIYSYLNNHLSLKASSAVDLLGSSLHVWPDFHGNRSPLADPTLKGMVRGHEWKLDVTRDMKYCLFTWLAHRCAAVAVVETLLEQNVKVCELIQSDN